MSRIKLLLNLIEDVRAVADDLQAIADAMVSDEPVKVTEPAAPVETEAPKAAKPAKAIKLEDVRAVLGAKSQVGLGNEVRELIKRYGGSKLSDVNPDCYAELLKEAEVL